ncbi:hypothetical protein CDAR_562891 [Caerostris darwini]|uniref:Uncharacterized protein n=1 Tax=Caerostris darwini TaxID=1538125 RepID=A0AAV4X9H3_9ARAC|nr:hypothetical protein CDAR_562891 [Caerostris darwini]
MRTFSSEISPWRVGRREKGASRFFPIPALEPPRQERERDCERREAVRGGRRRRRQCCQAMAESQLGGGFAIVVVETADRRIKLYGKKDFALLFADSFRKDKAIVGLMMLAVMSGWSTFRTGPYRFVTAELITRKGISGSLCSACISPLLTVTVIIEPKGALSLL